MTLHGQSIIAGQLTTSSGRTFHPVSPLDSRALEPAFHECTLEDVDQALWQAEEGFALYRKTSAEARAAFLETMPVVGTASLSELRSDALGRVRLSCTVRASRAWAGRSWLTCGR